MAERELVVDRQDGRVPANSVSPNGDAMLLMIDRAARDPAVDVVKLERLMLMAERAQAANAKAAYFAALSEMQADLPIIQERGEIKISNSQPGQSYALWSDINKAIKPVLKAHGFAFSSRIGQTETKITVTGVLSHREGHSEETTIHLPSDTSGSKNAVQAVGSSVSYGIKYTAKALLNLTSSDDSDDDGRGSSETAGLITADDIAELTSLASLANVDLEKFCGYLKVDNLSFLPKRKLGDAREALNIELNAVQRRAKGGK